MTGPSSARHLASAAWSMPWFAMLAVALAYATSALLAVNFLSSPPVDVVPIWPAAGVALVGLLVGGLRLWPGVAGGYLVFYAVHYGIADSSVSDMLQTPIAAVGPVLQSVIAAWLTRRHWDRLALGDHSVVLRLLVLAGPVACTLSSTLSVALLVWRGALPTGEALTSWLIWWTGDTLGVLMVAPLAIFVVPAAREAWRGRASQIVAPLLATFGIMTAVMSWGYHVDWRQTHEALALKAADAFDVVHMDLVMAVDAATATAHHLVVADGGSADEFRRFATRVLPERLSGLLWLPRGTDSSSNAADPVHVDAAVMQGRHEGLRSLDAASRPHLAAALERSGRTGMPTASRADRIVDGKDDVIFVFVPVPADSLAASTSRQPTSGVRGYVAAAIDTGQLAAALTGLADEHGLDFELLDVSGDTAPTVLASTGPDASGDRRSVWQHDLDYFGRAWRLNAYTANDVWQFGDSPISRVLLILCVLVALLVAHYVLNAAGHRRAVGQEVERRTIELREAHRQLEAAMSLSQVVDWELDVAAGEFVLSDRYYTMMRTTADQEGGYRLEIIDWVRRFVHPEDRSQILDSIRMGLRDAGHTAIDHFEHRQIRRDGEICYVAARCEIFRDEDGTPTHVFGTSQDISELRGAEMARRESDEYNRSIIESSKECIKVLDLDGRVIEMNPFGCALMEVEDFALIQDAEWTGFWERDEDRLKVQHALREAHEGRSCRFQGQTPTFGGTLKSWDIIVSPIMGADGRVARILGVSRDVTAEYAAKQAIQQLNSKLERDIEERTRELAASERQLRTIFEVAAIGIVFTDTDGNLLRANPKYFEIVGYDDDELIGTKPTLTTHPDDQAHDRALIDQLMAGELPNYSLEKRYVRKDGATTWVRVNASVVRGESGEALYRVAMIEDISAARRDREQLDASERRYRQLFDGNPMPMWTYDLQTLAFTSVNQAAISHYGYTREEFLAMTLKDIRRSVDIPRLESAVNSLTAGFHKLQNVRHLLKSGELIDVDITSHDVGDSLSGQRLVLATDITERRRVDALLEGQRQVLEKIARGAPLRESLEGLAGLLEGWAPGVHCAIMLSDPTHSHLDSLAAPSLPPELVRRLHEVPIEEGSTLCGTAAYRNAQIVAGDLASGNVSPATETNVAGHAPYACISVPIRNSDGGVLGTFDAYSGTPRDVPDATLQMMVTLTHTAAVAVTTERERTAREETEARFRAIFEHSPIGIVLASPDGTILAANPRQCELMDVREDEVIGQDSIQTYTHPDDISCDLAQFEQVKHGERSSYAIEKRALRKDGSEFWVSVSGSIVRNDRGEASYAVRMVQDITDRIRNERALRESEERYRATFELAGLGIWHIADGRFVTVNPHLCEITGYGEDELLAMAPDDLLDGDDRMIDPTQLENLWSGRIGSNSVEKRYIRKDGQPIWTNATISLVRGEENDGTYVLGIVEDVTRRKAAKEKLHQQEEVNRLLLENLAEGVVACDGDGQLMLFNRAAREWHGADPRNIPPEQWSQHYDLYEADGTTPLSLECIPLMRAFKGETVVNAEMSITRKGSQPRQVLASGAPLFGADGEKRGAVVVMHDITEQRDGMLKLTQVAEELKVANAAVEHERASLVERVAARTAELTAMNAELTSAKEAAEAASRAKSTFLATVSHEIRTPMNGVLGAMELMAHSGMEAEQAELLGTARCSARSLLGLLNDLLDMAKIEAGRIELSSVPTSLEAVLAEVITIHRPGAEAKGVSVHSHWAPGLPASFGVDDLRLKQILNNFVSNAVKFTSAGRIDVGVDSERLSGSRHRVRFTVQDTGSGIDADTLAVLFQPFEQGTAEVARKSGGTGLGLAISRGLAERMDGSVSLESTPGLGTTATLVLELEECGREARQSGLTAADEGDIVQAFVDRPTPACTGPVLVVDDHPVNRDVLVRQLKRLDIVAETASNGAEGLAKLRGGAYSLVITDCEMPVMDGYALADAIRHEGGDAAGIGIVAYTAHALPEVSERCYAAGIDVVLTKPVDLPQLARTLRRWWPVTADPHAAPMSGGREGDLLDLDQLALIGGGDAAVEAEILDDFLESIHASMVELAQAAEDADASLCRSLSHRSKGACLTVGAHPLAAAFSALHDISVGQPDATFLGEALAVVHREIEGLERYCVQSGPGATPRSKVA